MLSSRVTKKRKVTLGGLLGSKVKKESPEKPVPEVKDELENYLESLEEDDLELDVLERWKGKERMCPNLTKMVKQYFSQPAKRLPLPALSACFLRQEKCMMTCASQPRMTALSTH